MTLTSEMVAWREYARPRAVAAADLLLLEPSLLSGLKEGLAAWHAGDVEPWEVVKERLGL